MTVYRSILLVGVLLHWSCGAPIIGEIVSRVLSPPPLHTMPGSLNPPGILSELLVPREPSKNGIVQRSIAPPVTPKLRPPPPRLTLREVNRNLGRALGAVSILGQIDSYISDRARTIARKLLLLFDDEALRAQQGY